MLGLKWIHVSERGPRSAAAGTLLCPWGRFEKACELLNLRSLKFSPVNKMHIFQRMGKIFCVEFQRGPLKFHTKYLIHTLKDANLYNIENLRALEFKSS